LALSQYRASRQCFRQYHYLKKPIGKSQNAQVFFEYIRSELTLP